MKTSELIGPALDWAVAKALNLEPIPNEPIGYFYYYNTSGFFAPSIEWDIGGPIIEWEKITVGITDGNDVGWTAWLRNDNGKYWYCGSTPLIAAMRCFVASKLGNDVEIPEELK